jgi:spore coat protein E
MIQYKEIVTKAVIGKGKKTFRNNYKLAIEDDVDTVLGCWVINHNLNGRNDKGRVLIRGSFDVNIWYSYDGNTKTNVATKRVTYEEKVTIKLKEESTLTDNSEIIIRNLKNPSCVDVSVTENVIHYIIEKELGIEIIGDTKVKIAIETDEDDYDIIEDVQTQEEIMEQIDEEVKENYIDTSES